MTKKEQALYEQYRWNNQGDLATAYGRASAAKWRAWREIEKECEKLGGQGLHVCGHNSSFFSCGFEYNDHETGALRLRYYTHANIYDFEIEEVR